MGDGEGRELLFQLDGQHVGNGVLGAPVARDHKADALLPGQQRNVVGRLAGDKAVRAARDELPLSNCRPRR